MPQIEERRGAGRIIAIIALIVITFVYMVPILYIVNTSFKPWTDIRSNPTSIVTKPNIGSFIRIFTSRAVYPPGQEPTAQEIADMKWYERIVYRETNEKVVRAGDLPVRSNACR